MVNPQVGIAIGSHQFARDSFSLSLLEHYENEKNNYIFNSKIKELYYGYARNMIVRKSLFDEIGLFVERIRGSDVIFVHRCIDRYSCARVRYFPQVQVRHLEIENPSQYFHKAFIYGSSSQRYRQIVHARPLTMWERLHIFHRTVRGRRYSAIKSVTLLGLLAIGLVYWALGNISAAWNGRRKTLP
jgi:hypothetical protein